MGKQLFTIILCLYFGICHAQTNTLFKGIVVNGFTQEPIPYASLKWKISKAGVICDSLGKYIINKSSFPKDSIIVQYVGFESTRFSIIDMEQLKFKLTLENLSTNEGVTVKSKFNKGERWWKLVVKNKNQNNVLR